MRLRDAAACGAVWGGRVGCFRGSPRVDHVVDKSSMYSIKRNSHDNVSGYGPAGVFYIRPKPIRHFDLLIIVNLPYPNPYSGVPRKMRDRKPRYKKCEQKKV
jgi:hypothetical protein